MARIGSVFFVMGAISAALASTNYEVRLLVWIDEFGASGAWGIRIALMALGALLVAAGLTGQKSESVSAAPVTQEFPV